jgi:hypothetical protein
VLDENNENSLEQPKEGLWIHSRACVWAMDMPQPKRNENRYF